MIIKFLHTIFAGIDRVVFGLVINIYNLLYSISNTTISTGEKVGSIGTMESNLTTILGVIMLFKFAFSLITYIINPDQLADKNKGFGDLIKKVVVVVGLILVTPIIFNKAMELQGVVLEEDILGRVITGVSKEGGTTFNESAGQHMAFDLLSGFVRPNTDECSNVMDNVSSDEQKNDKGETPYEVCAASITDSKARKKFQEAYDNYSISSLLSDDVINSKNRDDDFYFTYNFGVSTLVGGFTAYILLMFCIDIAVRGIKLVFLKVISPIPIVSYLDLGTKKSNIFSKWVSLCVSTYLDIFIRLSAIYFAVFIIETIILGGKMQTIVYHNGSDPSYESPSILVRIFMILGCLMFAKQLPKLLEDMLGFKMNGDFTLNPFKKAAAVPLAGAALGAGIGGVVGGIDSLKAGKGFFNGAKSGVGTALSKKGKMNLKDITPFRQEQRKNLIAGRQEMKQLKNNQTDGHKMYDEYKAQAEAYNSGHLKEKPNKDDYLLKHLKSSEFRKTYQAMGKKKKAMYDRQNDAEHARAELNAAMVSNDQARIERAQRMFDNAQKAQGTATSQYEMAKKNHDISRKMYQKDAEIQDQFDLIDKTDPAADLVDDNTHIKNWNSNNPDDMISIEKDGVSIRPGNPNTGWEDVDSFNGYDNGSDLAPSTSNSSSTSGNSNSNFGKTNAPESYSDNDGLM